MNETHHMKLLECTGLRRFGIQLASCGEWENWFGADDVSSEAAEEWLAAADKDVAIESLFCDVAGGVRGFIGFRRFLENTPERCDYWLEVIERTKPLGLHGPEEHIALWLEILDQPSLLDTPAQGVELGVFNQWFSAGPISLHSDRLTGDDLQRGPDWLRRGATAPICREYQWATPADFWIADVVSNKEQDRYVLNRQLLPE